MRSAQAGVIGLGSVGAFALFELARRGVEVVGLEAFGVGNDQSAVGGDSRLFRRLYREGPAYHGLLERALELWRETDARLPGAFVQCGALSIVPQGSLYAFDLEAYGERFGVDYELLDADEVAERFPQFAHPGGDVGYWDPAGGYVRTDLVVRDAVDRALEHGATVIDLPALAIEPGPDGVVVRTAEGDWRFDRVVVAAGARTPLLLPGFGRIAAPQLQVMTWFQATDPERFRAATMPVFIREGAGFHAYGAPALDGLHVKVSGLTERRPAVFDGLAYDQSVTPDDLRDAEARIPLVLDDLHPLPVRTAIYPELYSHDGRFVIDFVDPEQRVLAATAFSGKGFKMANAIGEHVARVLVGEAVTNPDFGLARFADAPTPTPTDPEREAHADQAA
ncbi:MAG: FAD-dependent oxidoreductase [Microbacteriaceae bacterium]|nr:FAD-dependent oxidoreductase [Microbacteriaceae bacterium]